MSAMSITILHPPVNAAWVTMLRDALARAEAGESGGGIVIEDTLDAFVNAHSGVTRHVLVGALTIAAAHLAMGATPL